MILDICHLEKKLCDFAYLSYETILAFVRFLKYQTSTWIQKLFLAMTVTSGVVVSLPQTLCLITEYQHYQEVKILSLINRDRLCICLEKKKWLWVVTLLDYQPCI